MTAILTLNNVSKRYGTNTMALQDMNFSVKEGEFVSIIGPSGRGNQPSSGALTA